jgi:hypothetical protein
VGRKGFFRAEQLVEYLKNVLGSTRLDSTPRLSAKNHPLAVLYQSVESLVVSF